MGYGGYLSISKVTIAQSDRDSGSRAVYYSVTTHADQSNHQPAFTLGLTTIFALFLSLWNSLSYSHQSE